MTDLAWLAELPNLLTVAEAASTLRTSVRNCKRWIAAGRLHALRPVEGGSSRVLVPRASIEKFLRALEGAS